MKVKLTKKFIDSIDCTEPPRYCRRLNILREYDNTGAVQFGYVSPFEFEKRYYDSLILSGIPA